MHPIDYLAYRTYLSYPTQVHKPITGIVFALVMPGFITIIIPLLEKSPLAFLLLIPLGIFCFMIPEWYYTESKIESLCLRYKEHRLNKCPYFIISATMVLTSSIISIAQIFLFVRIITLFN